MQFETLENFEWLNDPENVRFDEDAMVIYAKPETDFWQSMHRGVKKDNGHFFFMRMSDDFILTLNWKYEKLEQFAQCGLMIRTDEKNWFKVSIMNEVMGKEVLVSSLTIDGHSDWCGFTLDRNVSEIWFRVQRVDNDYTVFYSLDGIVFTRLRMFYLKNIEEVKAGAYIANPGDKEFFARLASVKMGA